MENRDAMTQEQRHLLELDLADVRDKLQQISSTLTACYGEESQTAVRAEETLSAFQRLQWALERQTAEGASA